MSWEKIEAQFGPSSRRLEPGQKEWSSILGATIDYSQQFLSSIETSSTHSKTKSSSTNAFDESPSDFRLLLDFLEKHVLMDGLNAAGPRYMGYVPGGGLPISSIGDFLASLTNRYSGNFDACPGAATVENDCIRWMLNLIGFPNDSWGTLTSGGSLANFTAVLIARDRLPVKDWHKGVIYLSSESHHSLDKALAMAGLRNVPIRRIAIDANFSMDATALETQIQKDKRNGLTPWMILASAGTTNSGAIDPLQTIAEIARAENIWFHVDAAYGGFFLLVDSLKSHFRGIELADSVVLDPHKGLFLPYGTGAILIRGKEQIRKSLAFHPSYLADLSADKGDSPSDYSPELTRPFRALRLWLALKYHGVDRFRSALEEKSRLTQLAYQALRDHRHIELGPEPKLSTLTFRCSGDEIKKSNQMTERLLGDILASHLFYSSSTTIHDKKWLRLCILCFRTHADHVRTAVDYLIARR